MTTRPDACSVIAAAICEWDDRYADFEGDDLARVALEALTEAGYVVVKKALPMIAAAPSPPLTVAPQVNDVFRLRTCPGVRAKVIDNRDGYVLVDFLPDRSGLNGRKRYAVPYFLRIYEQERAR